MFLKQIPPPPSEKKADLEVFIACYLYPYIILLKYWSTRVKWATMSYNESKSQASKGETRRV